VAFGLIPEAGLLPYATAGFEDADVALDLVLKRFFQVTEGVEVFYFDFGAELFGATRAPRLRWHRSAMSLFHIAIAYAGVRRICGAW